LISSMIEPGRSVNRPPHILLLMTSRSRLLIRALALIVETGETPCGFPP
jgi:hypothetical protein